MRRGHLNRRDFLRLCLLSGAGAGLAACDRATPAPASSPTPPPTASPTPMEDAAARAIELNHLGGDAWTWKKNVTGHIPGPDCDALFMNVNGADVAAALTGDMDREGNLVFTADVPLAQGSNRIFATCQRVDGTEERTDMIQYQERLRYSPTATIDISLSKGKIVLDGSKSLTAEENGPKLVDHLWSPREGNPASLFIATGMESPARSFTGLVSGEILLLEPPAVDGEYYVTLTVKDKEGRQDTSTTYFVVENGAVRIPDYDKENTAWVENAVVYGVIPRKFGNPAFKAIARRLDDLADLGVTALWLAPVNVSPIGDYGYAVKDYFELNPSYGSKEEFHRMVQEAHQRGIRVLMDFVPNHSSIEHPYYADAKSKGLQSNYWTFYDRDETGTPTHYFDWTHLPNLNYENPEVRRMMIEAFAYWVREFDVDGFRVDAAWGVKQRRPDFWPEWRRELKRIRPDLLLLAEASARDPYYFDNGFDAAYDWTDQLGKWAWTPVWSSYKLHLLAYNLDDALTNRPAGFHTDALIFRFINNNDTGDRFITRHGEGVTRVATALLLTLPGIPCVYTGDEIGAEFQPYQDEAPLEWVEKLPGLRDYHKQLIALRRSNPSLHSRLWTRLEIKPAPQIVYGYVRYAAPHDQPVLVLLNFSEEPTTLEFDLPEEFASMRSKGMLTDLLSKKAVRTGGSGPLSVDLPAFGVRLLA